MKIYTIIGGVNGVGKTSLLGILSAERFDMGVIVDEYVNEQKIYDCLEKSINFTQETTLSGARTLKTIQRAREFDYYIRLYYIGINSAAESIARIGNRVRKDGHNIASEDVERRYEKRFEDLAKILPFCNEVRFYDNENGFADVAEFRFGTSIVKGEYIPHWITELKEYLKK